MPVFAFPPNSGMLAADFLQLLRCPETLEPLSFLAPEVLATVNARIAAGGVCNRAGERVSEPLDGALRPANGAAVYPIREGIPILLVEESILL